MKRLFISYAHAGGTNVAEWLYGRLTGAGYIVWKDDRSLPLGASFAEEISNRIGEQDHVLILVSGAALQSQWVQFELNLAETARQRIIPILIEPVEDERLPLNLRMRYCLRLDEDEGMALHRLVNHLDGSSIPRIVNLSGHTSLRVKNGLILKEAPFRHVKLADPDEITAYGVELARLALPYIQDANAGIVPPGLASLACVTLAYLAGARNDMPKMFAPHSNEQEPFQIDGARPISLRDVRHSGFQDRSNL
ncbi:MAG: hypothetical protein DCC57_20730 [Chloroflexi bacterium]|nr:MAG: hypothetical protein DCC57_20730 [Chloroflexota bacterium]